MYRTILTAAALCLTSAASAQQRPDLADSVSGTWHGAIISDARGSSASDITIEITRISAREVLVHCLCDRIPDTQIAIERVADVVMQSRGASVFLLENNRTPPRLNLSIDDASWAGERVTE